MTKKRKANKLMVVPAVLALLASMLTGCASGSASTALDASPSDNAEPAQSETEASLAKIDNSKWQYEASDDVYWQAGISYCASPADAGYETLGIYVPGSYMDATDNGDGTYTCTINQEASVAGYTAETAPVVLPVNTPGYAAMSAPTGYDSSVADYTNAGFVYLFAGCRGRDAGAPAGVTDLKAAVRFYRDQNGAIPGDADRIFTFGMSGGGAQSALMGATGNSALYTPYLEAIGAVDGVSDAVAGSMCWCPITNLDYADEAYEWNLGVTRTGLDDEMQTLSDDMAEAFAKYINALGLKDASGNVLTLSASDEGIYQSGSYYDYLKSVVEESLNNFLSDTQFPYDADAASGGMGGFGGGMPDGAGGKLPDGAAPGSGRPDLADSASAASTGDAAEAAIYAQDGIDRAAAAGGVTISGTYETVQDYIDALNANGDWVHYDAAANTAAITSIADFVTACKTASKGIGAFDALDSSQGENQLFGYADGNGAHFDAVLAQLLTGTSYADAFAADLAKTDAMGNTVAARVNLYNPLYYLCDYYEGAGTSDVASYWRIRTGINQSDTALTTETNLALALQNAGKTVDFATVWGMGHTLAERTGTSTENFIDWVNTCLK